MNDNINNGTCSMSSLKCKNSVSDNRLTNTYSSCHFRPMFVLILLQLFTLHAQAKYVKDAVADLRSRSKGNELLQIPTSDVGTLEKSTKFAFRFDFFHRSDAHNRVLQDNDRPQKGLEGTVIKRNYPTPQPDPTRSPAPSPVQVIDDDNFVDDDGTLSPTMFIPPGIRPVVSPTSLAPVATPVSAPLPSYKTTSPKDTATNRSIFISTCSSTQIPRRKSSAVAPVVLSFQYTFSLKDINSTESADSVFLNHLKKIESVMNRILAKKFLNDCNYTAPSENPFELLSLSSAPVDTIVPNETCGDNCRVINGYITPRIFYLAQQRRRQQSTTDPAIATVFGRAIVQMFKNNLAKFGSNIVAMEFLGMTNNGAYDTFGTDNNNPNDTDTTAGVQSQQNTKATSTNRGLGWGATIVALAALSLVVLTLFVIKRRGKVNTRRQQKQQLRSMDGQLQQDMYTYDEEVRNDADIAIFREKHSDDIDDLPPEAEEASGTKNKTTARRGFAQFFATDADLSSKDESVHVNGDIRALGRRMNISKAPPTTVAMKNDSTNRQVTVNDDIQQNSSTSVAEKASYYDYEAELDDENALEIHHINSNVRTLSYKIKSTPPTFIQARDDTVTNALSTDDEDPIKFLSFRTTRSNRSYDTPDTVNL